MFILAGFGKACCDFVVNKTFHKVVVQSAMVFYIFHRLIEQCMVEAIFPKDLKDSDAPTRIDLFWQVISAEFVILFVIYLLLNSFRVTRLMFGIEDVRG